MTPLLSFKLIKKITVTETGSDMIMSKDMKIGQII